MYNILLLDKDFKAIALIDDYQSLTWHRVYGNVGDFVLYLRPEVYQHTKDAYYLYLSDNKELALIECNELTDDQLIVRGNFYDTVYDREIVYPTQTFSNKYPEEIAYALINEYFPTIETPAEIEGLGSKITTQFTGKSVLEVLQDICESQALGFETKYSSTGNVLTFRLYQGLNRLSTQNENPFIDFSNNYDTLSEYEFTYDIRPEKNYALVAGEGEGDDRVTTTVDWSDGGDVKKLFVDARDLQKDEETTDAEYIEILKERGREKLAECTAVENIEVTPIMTNYEYRVDYDLGDLCAADILHKDPRTGEVIFKASLDKRITELDEVYENNALTLKLTLGEQYPTISNAISSGGSSGGSGSVSTICDMVYPVGSIYLSVNDTNPGTIFGGTWTAWGTGRVPVGVNTGDSNFNTVEKTGGASTVSLTEAQLPSHKHHTTFYNDDFNNSGDGETDSSKKKQSAGLTYDVGYMQNSWNKDTSSTGSGQAHNNLQPYITCYMWKRTA